ncbi:hypothetical protein B296_00043622 [Ensete ventricosum]|uniref:Uncharacterized protein n=1 Tax=Ensete ventricosum TaxID=4639 RepID=A0A426XCH1_ENSVE|nr:hypothetical protein B296_00043622 [Ensete ventricosum]
MGDEPKRVPFREVLRVNTRSGSPPPSSPVPVIVASVSLLVDAVVYTNTTVGGELSLCISISSSSSSSYGWEGRGGTMHAGLHCSNTSCLHGIHAVTRIRRRCCAHMPVLSNTHCSLAIMQAKVLGGMKNK